MQKVCLGCGLTKPVDEFHKAHLGKLGRQSKCKTCSSTWHKEYNARPDVKQNKGPRVRAYNKKWREKYPERHKENYAIWRAKTPAQALGKSLRRALLRHPTDGHVTLNDLMEIWKAQDGKCALSGAEMTWGRGTYFPTSISIDRIDSESGYTKSNVRLLCYAVNAFKGVWGDDHVIELAKGIVANMEVEDRPVSSFPPDSAFMVMQ